MTAGFESYNDSGILQLTQDAPTFTFVSKGLVTTIGSISFSATSSLYIDVPTSVTAPMIGTRAFAGVAPYYNNDQGNGYIRHYFNSNLQVGVPVAYYIFDLASTQLTPGNFGLEIYGAGGELQFSSTGGALQITTVITTGTYNLTTGRLYATCIPSFAGYRHQVTIGSESANPYIQQTGRQYGGAIGFGGGTYVAGVEEVDFLSSNHTAAAPDIDIPLSGMLILDVTQFGSVTGETTYILEISPSYQTSGGAAASYTFSAETASVAGSATITAYSWSLSNTSGGSWVIASGQGTASAVAAVSGVAANSSAIATLNCAATIGGTPSTISANLSFTNTNSGSVTISPTSQSQTHLITSNTFGAETISASGTITNYNWYFTNTAGGNWSITSGQGTASATARVTNVGSGNTATAYLVCDVTVDGSVVTKSAPLDYTHDSGQ